VNDLVHLVGILGCHLRVTRCANEEVLNGDVMRSSTLRATPRARRVLIAGRGVAGLSLASDVQTSGDVVVGYLDDAADDDDVLGPLFAVGEVCRQNSIDVVYFAIPSSAAEVLQRFLTLVPSGVEFAIIPRTYRIVSRDRVSVSDLTDVGVLDLVGRAPVKHDLEEGVDRSESGIFHLGQRLVLSDRTKLEIGDVQSEQRMAGLIGEYRPELLFHVAAYKHVPLMQDNPIEAFNNNVWGTLNILRQAAEHNVGRVVYVSTDKAVNPTNVMGATKRLGELMLQDFSTQYPRTKFNGVRFGNVLESEGSVMQTFRRQLRSAQNLTVTHPDITRYFMTIDEASQLVIQSATAGKPGDLFVLDMGDPIRVLDLARALVGAVNPSLDVQIIGLRPGEKMFEELSYNSSQVDSTSHPKIFIVTEAGLPEPGSTVRWAEEVVAMTRGYTISEMDLLSRMRDFGFVGLK